MAWTEGWSLALPVGKEDTRPEVDVAELVQIYGRLLFRVAYSVMRSRTEAEEVVQDVFVRVLERRGRLGEVREMRVWLVRIAWNLALDRRRTDAAGTDGCGVCGETGVSGHLGGAGDR